MSFDLTTMGNEINSEKRYVYADECTDYTVTRLGMSAQGARLGPPYLEGPHRLKLIVFKL